MISSRSLEKLIKTIEAVACPDTQMIQVDEDSLPRSHLKRDLFEQLIDSDQEESNHRQIWLSRRSSVRPESEEVDSSTMVA